MKKSGLIGGVGPESTIPYYRGILNGVTERVGKPYLPPLTIESLSCFVTYQPADRICYRQHFKSGAALARLFSFSLDNY